MHKNIIYFPKENHCIVSVLLHGRRAHTLLSTFSTICSSLPLLNRNAVLSCTIFLSLCDDLGVPIAEGKTVSPSTTLQFAGIILESIAMQATISLPEDKLTKCCDQLTLWYLRKRVTLWELQSLIVLLNFMCSVIVPGSAFLCRLIDLTRGIRNPRHFIRITRECKYDINVRLSFLQ